MNFEELSNIWNDADSQAGDKLSINQRLLREVSVSRIKDKLYEIKWTAYFELVVGFFWNIFLIGFVIDHFFELKFAFPAFLLLAISIFSMVLNGYQLKQYYSLRADESVLQTQKRVAYLRFLELTDVRSLLVIIPLFAAPFFIVTAKSLLGLDLYIFQEQLLQFTLGSIVVAVILVFFLLRYPNKALKESIAFLKEIHANESE